MSYLAQSKDGILEIRWHGRGGQGAISSAQILAEAAFYDGFKGVTAAPSFGAERRGAPVTASTRLSPKPVRVFSQIEHPDIVIVLDETLLNSADATAGLKGGGWLVINTPRELGQLGINGDFSIATADANSAAQEAGLIVAGSALVNTAMLGAFARATGIISLESIKAAIAGKFPPAEARRNFEAARLTYERTMVTVHRGVHRDR